MFSDMISQPPSMEHPANIVNQVPGVVILSPFSSRSLPCVILRADLLEIPEIVEYISQMRQGKWESIRFAFRNLEDYRHCIKEMGSDYPFSLINLRNDEGLELSIDPTRYYTSTEEFKKVVYAITQTGVDRLTVVAGSDDIPVGPDLYWGDMTCLVDALHGSNIHCITIGCSISMRALDWEGLYRFATALGHSGITEFAWHGMVGQRFDRSKAAQIFKEALTEEQWLAFGSRLVIGSK